MEYKVEHHIGTIVDEKYRLIFVGVPCYPIFRRFNELFTEWGGTFAASTATLAVTPTAAPTTAAVTHPDSISVASNVIISLVTVFPGAVAMFGMLADQELPPSNWMPGNSLPVFILGNRGQSRSGQQRGHVQRGQSRPWCSEIPPRRRNLPGLRPIRGPIRPCPARPAMHSGS